MTAKKRQRFKNHLRDNKLQDLAKLFGLQDAACNLTERCSFNFSYYDCYQDAGVDFYSLSESQQKNLVQSLVNYSKNSLSYWESQGDVFIVYGNFPPKNKTDFFHPKHVPHDVCWCRFRLAGEFRLVGFTVPGTLNEQRHGKTQKLYRASSKSQPLIQAILQDLPWHLLKERKKSSANMIQLAA
ncbi:MAG: hypothetical protein Q3M24_23340 [Candidatus Electrothrix aestuarii]|uniref:Uncharacterized protein n=1 Tax=Candidatus Electrothrix aestuarii TaxID=3062594 RepID=A0AAU8LVG8_9BACT|nr:hypothetical protein [Candidatus Electrothrix aestuarii]